jgi:predicted TIM-barrel fold metal-dependent hydrolase
MLGLRVVFHVEPNRSWLHSQDLEWFWDSVERMRIPVMMAAPGSVARVGEIAAAWPGARLTLDHFALAPDATERELAQATKDLGKVARQPNLSVKASCLPNFVTGEYPFIRLHPYLREVVAAFGADRVFWGTDFTRLRCSYRQAVTLFTEEIDLSNEDRKLIMGKGLREWLGWRGLEPIQLAVDG